MQFKLTFSSLATLCLYVFSILAAPVYADEQPQGFSLGFAAIYEKNTFIGQEDETGFFPMIEYQGERWHFALDGVSYKLYQSPDQEGAHSAWGMDISLFAGFGWGKRDEDDASIFKGMDEREDASTIGVENEIMTPFGLFNLTLLKALNGAEHTEIDASYRLPLWMSAQTHVLASLGATFSDKDYANYFYGVRLHEARPNRAAYEIDEAITNPYFGLQAMHSLNKNWHLIGHVRYVDLDDAIIASSLTSDEDHNIEGVFGINYTFD